MPVPLSLGGERLSGAGTLPVPRLRRLASGTATTQRLNCDRLLVIGGPFQTQEYWWLADQLLVVDGPFFRHHLSNMASMSQKQRLVRTPTKRTTKHELYKQRIASSGSPVFKTFSTRKGDRRSGPTRFHSREKQRELRTRLSSDRSLKCSRLASADRSPPRAIVRRTIGDRRSTGKMA